MGVAVQQAPLIGSHHILWTLPGGALRCLGPPVVELLEKAPKALRPRVPADEGSVQRQQPYVILPVLENVKLTVYCLSLLYY